MRKKDPFLFTVKVFSFLYVPQNIHGHFQSYFQNDYTQSLRHILLFIALNYLTNTTIIANLC